MAQPLHQSDIIFPHLSNTPNFSSTLSSLKRSALSITNRLNSITKDSEFVTSVAASYNLPLVANERCGSWYIPLDLKVSSVYFKSTDGHMGEWAFSLRRLNLQLLDVVNQYGGCLIVDSTRRGKSMPDARSKTVPFWCCIINRTVFGSEKKGDEALNLFTPPTAVSESENAQMEKRVNGFVQQFLVGNSSLSELKNVTWLTTTLGYLQTRHSITPIQTSEASPPTMGYSHILPSTRCTGLPGIPSHYPLYCVSSRSWRRSIRRRLHPRRGRRS